MALCADLVAFNCPSVKREGIALHQNQLPIHQYVATFSSRNSDTALVDMASGYGLGGGKCFFHLILRTLENFRSSNGT